LRYINLLGCRNLFIQSFKKELIFVVFFSCISIILAAVACNREFYFPIADWLCSPWRFAIWLCRTRRSLQMAQRFWTVGSLLIQSVRPNNIFVYPNVVLFLVCLVHLEQTTLVMQVPSYKLYENKWLFAFGWC